MTSTVLDTGSTATARVPIVVDIDVALVDFRPAYPGERNALPLLLTTVHGVLAAQLGDGGDQPGILNAMTGWATR